MIFYGENVMLIYYRARANIKRERSGEEKTQTRSDRKEGDETQSHQPPRHSQPRAHQAQPQPDPLAQDRERGECGGERGGWREEETFGQPNVLRNFTAGV